MCGTQAASLLANYDASATAVREKVASVSTYLHDIGLPEDMQLTVRTLLASPPLGART